MEKEGIGTISTHAEMNRIPKTLLFPDRRVYAAMALPPLIVIVSMRDPF